MSKYIDVDKLIAEIESLYDNMLKRNKVDKDNSDYWAGKADAYRNVIDTITSLQQEQPDADLEKAARYVYESWMGGTMDDVCRDMVELGKVLNARKEK